MFQNKRRRYSHESRRDTVRRRPLPGIGVFYFNVCSTGSAVFFRSVG